MLLFSCTQILSGYIYNTVCVDIKGNLNLRNSSPCRGDSIQTELTKGLIVPGELTLALYYMDIYRRLIIRCCGEYLALLCRNRGISLNQLRSYAAQSLDRQ